MLIDFQKMRHEGDPLADNFVVSLLDFKNLKSSIDKVSTVFLWLRSVNSNKDLKDPDFPKSMSADIQKKLKAFLLAATEIPDFADPKLIKQSEDFFDERGYLSSLIYLCASLPEVYVLPDISSMLHVTGQLENAAEQRIRSTATMVLSVLLPDGILSDKGVGRVLILRARLIHSVLRVLLVRGRPDAIKNFEQIIDPIHSLRAPSSLFELAYLNGWNLKAAKIPCNQMELLYTLMTFSYIFLRSLRRFHLVLTPEQETAYLHTWNVVGHLMGINSKYLPGSYSEAEFVFNEIQNLSLKIHKPTAAQKHLGQALLSPLEKSLRQKALKPLARFLTCYLTSPKTIRTLQLWENVDKFFYNAFPLSMKMLRRSDRLFIRFYSNFSLAGSIYKTVSLAVIENVLMDQNQPVALPKKQLQQMQKLLVQWKS